MKTKDIVVIGFCGIIITIALYFAINMMFPKANNKVTQSNTITVAKDPVITGKIDEETLNKLKTFKDYGEGTLENIGRVNPFSPIK